MSDSITQSWRLYQNGLDYNRRIGLYETVRRNERFYRGEQWSGVENDLPHPVFNMVRRITDHLIGSVAPGELSIHYTDDRLPFLDTAESRQSVAEGLSLLNRNASYRWVQSRMNELSYRALLDAAVSGDGVFYCWWDTSLDCGQPFCGDIRTELIPNTDFFVADPLSTDVQSQDYILLSGRASVASLREEALKYGVSKKNVEKILPDPDGEDPALSGCETVPTATFIIRFYRENGKVVFEKSTKDCLIRRAVTGLKYYPVAYFNWFPSRNSYHGSSPISEMIPNQKYVNAAYALVMKHMSDTAFSKVVYDKSRIPEWSNEVGEAIAAVGGGNVSDAVSVLGAGKLQDGYLDLIQNVIENTRAMMGATESALGDERANNTSAILALQEASRIALLQVESRFTRCIEELASIWADMLCTYSPAERLLVIPENENFVARPLNYKLLKNELLHATAEATPKERFVSSAMIAMLDHLLDKGHISVLQYLQHLPEGCINDRNALIQELSEGRSREE